MQEIAWLTVCRIPAYHLPMPKYDIALKSILEKVGGPTKLAEALGVVPSAVTQWSRVPARHVPRVAALAGVDGRMIRPDLYPSEAA